MNRKALWFVCWLYSFLIWLYVVFRIIINGVYWEEEFILGIPITFDKLGIASLCWSFFFLYLFLNETWRHAEE